MRPVVGISAHRALVSEGETVTYHEVAPLAYVKAVRKAGGVPVVLPLVDPEDAPRTLERLDAIVLTGGGDVDPARYGEEPDPRTSGVDPERDARDVALVLAALELRLPALCICRGAQILAVALGGSLVQHVEGHFDRSRYNQVVHEVEIDPPSELGRWAGRHRLGTNSLHHQAVRTPGRGLVCARASDGTIEGLAAPGAPIVGVQWHPELLRHRAEHLALFEALVELGADK